MKHLFGLVLLALVGCPAPSPPPAVTVLDADGATTVVSIDSACANLHAVCGASVLSCTSGLNALAGGAPEDLVCMTTAPTIATAKACAGVGSFCP